MKTIFGALRRASRAADGFTVAELLAAVFVLSVGIVAVGAGFATAIQGVETSRQQTTATFLAEQLMEQIRATALGDALVACMGFTNITTTCFPAQAYGAITSAPGYRMTVTITDCPSVACVPAGTVSRKLVEVEVFYRPVVAWGVLNTAERSVRLSTLVTNHT